MVPRTRACLLTALLTFGAAAADTNPERIRVEREMQQVLQDIAHLQRELQSSRTEHAAEQQHDQARKTEEERTLDDLVAGMVLADHVRMRTGAFVMASDTVLDDYAIDKLKRYHTIGTITNKVLIRKSSARS